MYRGLSHCVPKEPLRLKEGKSRLPDMDDSAGSSKDVDWPLYFLVANVSNSKTRFQQAKSWIDATGYLQWTSNRIRLRPCAMYST